ncbi:MAG: hypothetical protein KC442_09520, partial [Thermomicrobiales bacterium]|nr:hypothetical protein [Thermomicrobiales bacterium]
RYAFPYLQQSHRHRSYVHNRLNVLRLLRNRTMHHEPIWNGMTLRRQQNSTTHSLAELYEDILEVVAWTSPRLRDSIIALDPFPDTLRNGHARFTAEIETFLGI